VIFFTDAVFAIVLNPDGPGPEAAAPQEPAGQWGRHALHGQPLLSIVMSFFVIGVFWIAHAGDHPRMRHFDWASAWPIWSSCSRSA